METEGPTAVKLYIQNEMLLFEFYTHLVKSNIQCALLVFTHQNLTLADSQG